MADEAEKPVESAPEAAALAAAPVETPVTEPVVEAAPVIEPAPIAAALEEVSAPAIVAEPVTAEPVVAKVEAPSPVSPSVKRKYVRKAVKAPAKPQVAPPAAVAPAKTAVAAKPVRKAAVKLAAKPAVRNPKPAAPVKPKTVITSKPFIKNIGAGKPTLSQSKETHMAKTTTDFTAPLKTAIADIQVKAKAAYEKGTAAFGEANDFAKGNVEAIVESSKILASGLQELGTAMVTDSRAAFETATTEVKDLAAVKTPAEFFQLQSALVRKNFDTAVAHASKSTEAMLKLANEVMTPLSTRITLAVEKASKAA